MTCLDFETLLLSSLLRRHAIASVHRWLEYSKASHFLLEPELERLESTWVACLNSIIGTLPEPMRGSIHADDRYPKLVLPTSREKAFPTNEPLTEILLVILEPSDDPSSRVRCNLSATSLGPDCWPYDVLSYEWGDPSDSKPILLGGEEIHIPASLDSALRQLRYSDTPLTLWVDALCVDQQDAQGWQHGIDGLRAIYSSSQQIHIWLGDDTSGLKIALGFIEYLCRDHETKIPDFLCGSFQEPECLEMLEGLLNCMGRPWWNRAGLLQQLLRGCCVKFCCEGYSMTSSVAWDVLARFLHGLRKAYLNAESQKQSGLQVFTEIPYLVPADSLGYFPSFNMLDLSYQIPNSVEALSSVVKRIFMSPNKAQAWVLALAKIGTYVGVFLTHATVSICRGGPEMPQVCTSEAPLVSKTGESGTLCQNRLSQKTPSSQNAIDDSAALRCWLQILDKLGVPPAEVDTTSGPPQCRSDRTDSSELSYKTRDSESSSLQVLVLLPSAKVNSDLHGQIVWVDLDRLSALGVASCPYFAVSHVFLNKESTGSIFLQGKETKISTELALSLQNLRRPTQPMMLRIEAPSMTTKAAAHPWTRELILSKSGQVLTCQCDQGNISHFHLNNSALEGAALSDTHLKKEITYSPIDSSKAEIRLIIVKHGWRRDPIRCYLDQVSLDDSPRYEALSYVWGGRSNPGRIFLNGQEVSVTRNLACALEFLRHPTQDRTMWIDALCINQGHIAERNSQVQLMRRIYCDAWQVVSWLGDRVEGAEEASQVLSETKGCELSTNWFRQRLSASSNGRQRRGIAYISVLLSIGIEYWCRVWITQEVALARKGILQSGEWVVEYDDVRRFAEAYKEYLLDDATQITRTFGAQVYTILRETSVNLLSSELQQTNAPGTPLLKLLQFNRQKNATDPRDKVYALIGLSDLHRSSHPGLQIDYSASRTVRDVYIGVVQAVVDETSSLDIICQSAGRGLHKSEPEAASYLALPSWVPDWSSTAATLPFGSDSAVGAAGGSPASVGFSIAGDILTAAGFCVGTVGYVGEALPPYEIMETQTRLAEVWNVARSWYELAKGVQVDIHYLNELFSLTISSGLSSALVRHADLIANEYAGPPAPNKTSFSSEDDMTDSERRETFLAVLYRQSNETAFFLINPINRGPLTERSTLPLMGLSLPEIKEGDKVCILLGCKMPVVIRPDGGGYRFVSAAYIEPLKKGEAMESFENGLYDLDCFEIY